MADASQEFAARMKRVNDAIELKEPDRVPVIPSYTAFPFLWAGYSMKECMYDQSKAQDAIKRYLTHFEPDMDGGYGSAFCGQGPLLELLDPVWLEWAGKPGSACPDDSMHQYIEREYMTEDDYAEAAVDFSGWLTRTYLPRTCGALKGLAGFDPRGGIGFGYMGLLSQFLNPALGESLGKLQQAAGLFGAWAMQSGKDAGETAAMGFPTEIQAVAYAPFDIISDYLRGSIGAMMDMMTYSEEIHSIMEQLVGLTVGATIGQAKMSQGRFIFMPLHKGMDRFMSDEQYDEFYFKPLMEVCNGLIGAGLTPWLYAEGPYNSRIERLKDLPKGKCWLHFEEADMRTAKKELGDTVCLSGGISVEVLRDGTVEDTVNAVKENIDILAPGGGYIFDMADNLDSAKPENADALFETLRDYGTY